MKNKSELIAKVEEALGDKGTLVLLISFGSHLYGTNTEFSDTDYKGIYVPSYRSLILNKFPETIHINTKNGHGEKNTSEDIDVEITAISKFISLARAGETMALDVLHVNEQNILFMHTAIIDLINSKSSFYTKNLKAFVGYARKQAAKYGLKGSRLDAIQSLITVLTLKGDERLSSVWDLLPVGEHCRFLEDTPNGVHQYEVCGKILQSSMKTSYALEILEKYYQSYGARALQAQKSEGVDWKAISHAFRAAYQVRRILLDGYFRFPLPEAEFLREVKLGKFEYPAIAEELEKLIEEVDLLSQKSTLPEKVDQEMCNNFVYNVTVGVNGNEI